MAATQSLAFTKSLKSGFGVKPEDCIYEDEKCVVFDEYSNPQAPVHYVVVPKPRIPRIFEATVEDEKVLGHMLLVAKDIAISKGIQKTGYHAMVDEDHRSKKLRAIHVFGRALQHMLWPTGPGSRL